MEKITQALDSQILVDLTAKAREGAFLPVFGRGELTEKILRTFLKFSHCNALIAGPPQIGKQSVLNSVVMAIAKGTGIPELDGLTVYSLDVDKLVEQAKTTGPANQALDDLLNAFAEDPNRILALYKAERLLYNTFQFATARLSCLNFQDLCRRRKIRFVGVVAPADYDKNKKWLREKWKEWAEFFEVPELEPEMCVHAMQDVRKHRENHYGIRITDEALNACVQLSHRYVKTGYLPAKAIQLLDSAVAKAKMDFRRGSPEGEARPGGAEILTLTEDIVASVVSEMTGIPVGNLTTDQVKTLRGLEAALQARIIGQETVIRAVAQTIRATRAGFGDPRRPDGVFYFVGPSGVGKTEMALALAEILFGDARKVMRIDMSEFKHAVDVNRLIGSAPGYVGYEAGGTLTHWIRQNPTSVVLLDEFEKAYRGCWDLFLQVFDAGRLTDGKGEVADFSNAIVIMTSNLGSELYQKKKGGFLGFAVNPREEASDIQAITQKVRDRLKKVLPPEFLNRIDEILVFQPLAPEQLLKIAQLMLEKCSPVRLHPGPGVLDFLVKQGYEPQYGARHLRRAIQDWIEEPLAELIIEGKCRKGDDVRIALNGDNLTFDVGRVS